MSRIDYSILDRAIRELTNITRQRSEFNVQMLICMVLEETTYLRESFGTTNLVDEVCLIGNEIHRAAALELNMPNMSIEALNHMSQNESAIKCFTDTFVLFLVSESVANDIAVDISAAMQNANRAPTILTNNDSVTQKIEELRDAKKTNSHNVLQIQSDVGSSEMPPAKISENVGDFTRFMVSIMKIKWSQIQSMYIRTKMGDFRLVYSLPFDSSDDSESD